MTLPSSASARASTTAHELMAVLRQLDDGAIVEGPLLAALIEDWTARAHALADGVWTPPILTRLHIRRRGALEAWSQAGNVCLAGEGAGEPQVSSGFSSIPARDGLLVLGRGAQLHKAAMTGEGGLIIVGDAANLYAASLSAIDGGVIMVGEQTNATFAAQLDARNGGGILIGPDGLWANDLRIITDDMHAIRDLETGRRLNRLGGRVVVGRHVWFGERVALLGDCRIGADTVVGMGSFVKGASLPPNAVCAGQPARIVRTGTTWTREDMP